MSAESQIEVSDDPGQLLRGTPVGTPPLRESDLSSDPSRLETLLAAPSDDQLQTMWTIWSAVFTVYSIIILVVFLGIVSSKRIRKQPFHHYLIYLMLPDILYTVLCSIQCASLAIMGGPNTPASCRLQAFYIIFGNGANSWMNAIIAYQIHKLLQTSHRGERYSPSTKRQILLQSLCAYAFAAFFAILGILPNSVGIPVQTAAFYGLGCLPTSYDTKSSIFFWIFYYPAFSLIPMLYLFYVTVDIWWNNLLPKKGRRRQISLYYLRILIAVYVMWLPALITIYVFSLSAWPFMFAGIWFHAQGAVSAICSLMDKDVYRAVRNFICCKCREENDTFNANNQASTLSVPNSTQLRRGSSFLTVSGLSLPNLEVSQQRTPNTQQKVLVSQASAGLQSIEEDTDEHPLNSDNLDDDGDDYAKDEVDRNENEP